MKLFSILLAFTFVGISFAQTAVIRTKSHAGEMTSVLAETDNFGGPPENYTLPPEFMTTRTIELIDDHCFVYSEKIQSDVTRVDTVCDLSSLELKGYTYEVAREIFGEEVILKGFPSAVIENTDPEPADSSDFWINGTPFQNRVSVFLILVFASLLIYTITPIFKKK